MSKLFTLPKEVILTNAGALIPGAKAYFYVAGTATPQSVYTDYTLGTPHANPVVADGNGRFPTIYYDPTLEYKVVIKDASDVEIYSQDYVTAAITQDEVAEALYPQTSGESSAGITPTNYEYPPGNVLRYGTNTTPGTTDMTEAWQNAIDCGEKEIVCPAGDYLVQKTTDFSADFPNSDQPCLFVKNKTNMVIRGEGGARVLVNEHAQGIMEMQGCTDCEVVGLEFVGPTDFPDLDGTTGEGEKGSTSNGYNTTNAGIWGLNKNNSLDTSANTGGGFSGNFPQYTGGTASSWGAWNDGYIGNVSFGLLIQKGCVRITVRNCKASGFNYCGFGVGHLGDSTYTENEDIKFLDCHGIGNQSAGIHTMAVDGVLVSGCTLSNNGHPDAAPITDTVTQAGYGYTARGVATYYTKNAVIEGNLVEDNVRKGLDSHAHKNIQFIGNTIRNCGTSGISAPWTSATQPCIGTIIKGNLIENCSYGTNNLAVILGGAAIDAGYQAESGYCDLVIDGNVIKDCGGTGIEIKNGRNIQITNNILRGFDDRATHGNKYFMFLGRDLTDEKIWNMNVSGNVCDADGDTDRYRGISVRRAINSQVNHNMVYLDHASASEGISLTSCTTTQAFGNIAYVDSGATSSVPINFLATDSCTIGNYSDPDVGTLSYLFGNEGTTGEKEHALRSPFIIQMTITFNSTTSPSYTVTAGEDYVSSVGELATYGVSITFKNLHSTYSFHPIYENVSADGVTTATTPVTYFYNRGVSNTGCDIGMKQGAGGTDIIASNATGGTLQVTIFVY